MKYSFLKIMTEHSFRAREICYQEGEDFHAISLDFDLFAEGKTREEAMQRLRDATMGYLLLCIQDNELDEEIYRTAPKKYHDMFQYYLEEAKTPRKSEKKKKGKYHKKVFSVSTNDYDNICA